MRKPKPHVHKVSAHMVAAQQIVLAVANRFRLPIEKGYDIELTEFGVSGLNNWIHINVTAPEWGRDSCLIFSIEKDGYGIWYPLPSAETLLSCGSYQLLPLDLRDMQLTLQILRKEPKEGRVWIGGPISTIQSKNTPGARTA